MLTKYPFPPNEESLSDRMANFRKLFTVMVALAMVVVVGTLGFMLLEGMSALDALYMTVITLSTVGFSEVSPMHPLGRIFTMVLIVFGVSLGAFGATAIGQIILEGQLRQIYGKNEDGKQIEKDEWSSHYCRPGSGGATGR